MTHLPGMNPHDSAAEATAEAAAVESVTARLEHLRQEAHELFAKDGLGVPLADIAKAAGVGVATLYRRYRDKDLLILEVYREHLDYGEKLSIDANGHEDPWEGLVYFLTKSTEQFLNDRGMRELILGGYVGGAGWARGSSHQELHEALDSLQHRITHQLEFLVARAKEQQVVRDDFEPTDMLLMSAMAHVAAPVKESGWPVSAQRALTLLLEGIRPS